MSSRFSGKEGETQVRKPGPARNGGSGASFDFQDGGHTRFQDTPAGVEPHQDFVGAVGIITDDRSPAEVRQGPAGVGHLNAHTWDSTEITGVSIQYGVAPSFSFSSQDHGVPEGVAVRQLPQVLLAAG